MVVQFITFKVKFYDIYGWWIYYICGEYYIYGQFLLHYWLVSHLWVIQRLRLVLKIRSERGRQETSFLSVQDTSQTDENYH